jgi:hypothetical protein
MRSISDGGERTWRSFVGSESDATPSVGFLNPVSECHKELGWS